MTTAYGDISPRTAAYVAKELLKRALPFLVLERFGQSKPIPRNQTNAIKFRRYEAIPIDTTPLVEGVTPASVRLTHTDVTATLKQYGKLVTITDLIFDTHEDPVLKEATMILAEQAAQTLETVRYNVLKAGTVVQYTNGTSRTDVNTVIDKTTIRKAVRALERQDARKFTSILKSTPNYDTHPIQPAYWAVVHVDWDGDLRDTPGMIRAEKYGTEPPIEMEIGSIEGVRFVKSTIFTSITGSNAGGTPGSMVSADGSNADVYLTLVFGRDAYGIVPLKGEGAITPMVVNPKPSDSDPMAQRGHVSWKAYHVAVILNESWMVRIESAATD